MKVTSAHEHPVYFPVERDTLFGIFTVPPVDPNGVAVIILSGGGATAPATNRNRMSVHLARELATHGYHTLRFDYHGIGESTGVLSGPPKVDEPYLEDLAGAIEWVRQRGIERFVLVGACFGARTALSYAADAHDLESLILISPPLRDIELGEEAATRLAHTLTFRESVARALRFRTLKGLFHPSRRQSYRHFIKVKVDTIKAIARTGSTPTESAISSHFVDPLRDLVKRALPVSFIYGTEDWHYRDFVTAREGGLGKVLEKGSAVDLVVLEGEVHGLATVKVQEEVMSLVLERLSSDAKHLTAVGSN
ncbi:MAG: alpha/beta fold hydrolase [Actinomycetota bacterium]